jgi:DNA-binding response OmpR family regulator
MDMPKRKVLIIEDNQDLQKIYKYAFEEGGYEARVSGDGLGGITEVVDYKPDVILLDIMMPEMNGYQFIEALNNNTSLKIPIVVVTNLTQDIDKQQALHAGASLFLTKAEYDGPDLVAKVDELLANPPKPQTNPYSEQ